MFKAIKNRKNQTGVKIRLDKYLFKPNESITVKLDIDEPDCTFLTFDQVELNFTII